MILRSKEVIILLLSQFFASGVSGSDCPESTFACDRQKCIPQKWVCDGTPDCRDNTDESEATCPDRGLVQECRDDQFLCSTGTCIPNSWKCDGGRDCSDGSDETPQLCHPSCSEQEFTCGDGQCIDLKWRCDGLSDCFDESDEKNCTAPTPAKEQTNTLAVNRRSFTCGDGFRIPGRWVCDGQNDCRDHSDESDCDESPKTKNTTMGSTTSTPASICKASEFECPGSFCIPQSWVCDGMRECLNGEDERNCPPRNCTSTEHRCKDGTCILFTYVCNGESDCPDASDEVDCNTTPKSTTTTTTSHPPKATDSSAPQPLCQPDSQFDCGMGICISKERVCDGTSDCIEGKDESTEICGINECKRNNGACMHKCVDTRQGYHCKCDKGYRLIGKYNCEDIDECKEIPGVCSQECTNTIGGFHCSCFSGYMRDPANYTRCKAAHGETFLLFSHSFDIRQLRLRDSDMTSVVEDTRLAIALDYIFEDRQILWSDNKERRIYRANLTNTNDRMVLISDEDVSADGLAVDWIHKNIYFTNSKKNSLFLLSWDGTWLKTIVDKDVGSPRAIAVSPQRGYIFWTDWGINAKIERASLDGTDRKAIVTNPQHVQWPNGLTIDHPTEKIYWCDGYLRTIFSSDIHGSSVEVVLHSPSVLNHPFSISVFEDRLYWTDWSKVALFSADKFTGGEIVNVSAGHLLEAPKVVHVFHEYRQPKSENVCQFSQCEHLCVKSIDGKPLCVCADGYVLDSDSISCIEEIVTTIAPTTDAASSISSKVQAVVTSPPSDTPNRPLDDDPNILTREKLIREEIEMFEEKTQENSHIGYIIGGTFGTAVAIAALIALYVVHMRNSRRAIRRTRFHNPVYKNTTVEDDERGFTITQEELFSKFTSGYRRPADTVLTDADDAPLSSNIEE